MRGVSEEMRKYIDKVLFRLYMRLHIRFHAKGCMKYRLVASIGTEQMSITIRLSDSIRPSDFDLSNLPKKWGKLNWIRLEEVK